MKITSANECEPGSICVVCGNDAKYLMHSCTKPEHLSVCENEDCVKKLSDQEFYPCGCGG